MGARNELVLVDPPEGFDWNQLAFFAIEDDTHSKLFDEINLLAAPYGRRATNAFLKQLERMRYFKELNPGYVLSGKPSGVWNKVFQFVQKFKLTHREALRSNDEICNQEWP